MTKEEIEQEVARIREAAGIVMRACAGGCGKQIEAQEYECYECQGRRRTHKRTLPTLREQIVMGRRVR
jgi:hypothetical protein